MKKLLLITLLALSITSCKDTAEKESSVTDETTQTAQEKIAMANGFDKFDSIQKIRFTFNVKMNDTVRSQRRWVWNIKSDKISLTENDSVVSYIKKDSLSNANAKIDQKFVNDSYWLLFPYQLKWSSAEFSEPEMAKAPISEKEMQMLTVSFSDEGGYTPGDSYDIYYDDDFMIQEWVYKAAGSDRQMTTTWEDYQNYDGLKISKMHKSKDGNFELYFSDIEVE